MRVVIDTSSLMALVRYYIPLDEKDFLKKVIKEKIDKGEIIFIDKVFEESKQISKGVIILALDFLKNKPIITKTENILPEATFIKDLENRFCYGAQKNKLNDTEFESEKLKYLNSADAKLILYCLAGKDELEIDKPILVTEETTSDNDKKLFKKIPQICDALNVSYCNLTDLLKVHFNLTVDFK